MRESALHVHDMLEACRRAADYAEHLLDDAGGIVEPYGDAVLHNLVVLGEAATLVAPELQRDHPDVPWAEMARMRDVLVHRYFGIEWAVVIDTVNRRVPLLIESLLLVLADATDDR